MSARGLLANPAMFAPLQPASPLDCASRYLELATLHGGSQFSQVHQHVHWMLERGLSRHDRALLHAAGSCAAVMGLVDRLTSGF